MSDDESDFPLMECLIMTRCKAVVKNVSTVDKEVQVRGRTSYSSSLKDDCLMGETSEFTYVDKSVSDRSPGSKVNDDVQVGQTSVWEKRSDSPTRSIDEHKIKKK